LKGQAEYEERGKAMGERGTRAKPKQAQRKRLLVWRMYVTVTKVQPGPVFYFLSMVVQVGKSREQKKQRMFVRKKKKEAVIERSVLPPLLVVETHLE